MTDGARGWDTQVHKYFGGLYMPIFGHHVPILWLPITDSELLNLQYFCMRRFLNYLVVVYNTLVTKTFEAFVCQDRDQGKSFLRVAPEFTCWEGYHNFQVGMASVGVLLYVIGIPSFYVISLSTLNKRNLMKEYVVAQRPPSLQHCGPFTCS